MFQRVDLSIAGVSVWSEQIVVPFMLEGSGFKAFVLIGSFFAFFDAFQERLSFKF